MKNIITLYHGATNELKKIDVTKGKRNKDFGRGFYASPDVRHAERSALRIKSIEEQRSALRGAKKSVTPRLYAYEFDLDESSALNVKEFGAADREWIRFVLLNRESKTEIQQHEYDVVIGPGANDDALAAVRTVMPLASGEILTDRAIDALLALIERENLPRQFFFGAQRAADLLQFKERRIIR
jgi:hypothetical protein